MRLPVDRIRFMKSPYCNKLYFVGGRAKAPDGATHYVFGKGTTEKEALERLGGEAVERVCALAPEGNRVWKAEDPVTGEEHCITPKTVFGPTWRANSHGCAAHNHYKTAQCLAALELFERRAVEDWWLGRTVARRVDMKGQHGTALAERIGAYRQDAAVSRQTEVFEIGRRAGIFVIAALSSDQKGGQMAIAFAAHYDWTRAALRAAQEVMSVELETADLVYARLATENIEAGSDRALVRDRQKLLQVRYGRELATAEKVDLSTIKTSWPSNLDALSLSASEDSVPLLFVDMTMDSIGMPVSRAIFKSPPHLPFQNPTPEILPL